MIGPCFLPLDSTAVCGAGTLDEPLRTLDLLYFVHPSVEYRSALSADMSVDVSKYRSILDRHIGEHVDRQVGRQSADKSANTPVSTPVDTRPIRGVSVVGGISVNCQWKIGRLSVAYRSTVVQYMYNIICVLKSEQGSWVPVLHASYCSAGFEN